MKRVFVVVLLLVFSGSVFGNENSLKLANVFASNMVLQQQSDAVIWGVAEPNKSVSITVPWSKKVYKATVGSDGRWRTTVRTPKAGGPFTLTIKSGEEAIELKNVLSGEVWICSGQSNMQWRMRGFGLERWKDDIDKANYPNIRYCQVDQLLALETQEDAGMNWSVCTPKTAYGYSAVAFFFGTRLYQELDVPIGLIGVNWGGSTAEAWMSEETLRKQFPEFNEKLDEYPAIAKESGGIYTMSKADRERRKGVSMQSPAAIYNSMLKSLIPFSFRGVIWYQGESNIKEPVQYRTLFPALIKEWRDEWAIGEFPFYFVQLAPFSYKNVPHSAAYLREAQMKALSVPNTGMVVTMDIGNPDNIHPKQKKPVGDRLALLALAKDYGKKNIVYSGPLYKGYRIEGDKIRVGFDHIGSGLATLDGKELTHFTIAGKDKVFVEAKAVFDGKTIVVNNEKVSTPIAVRFGWGSADITNLANKEGLPASSFRTDDWPIDEK